jgi:hypothetical protein
MIVRMKKTIVEFLRLKLTHVLGLSAALIILANYLASRLELTYWQPTNTDALNIFAYQHAKEPYDILFLGSSHIKKGVVSKVVEKELRELTGREVRAFNLGQRGAHILTNYAVLRDALENRKRPRVAVVELSPASLNFNNKDKEISLKYYCSQGDILRLLPSFRTKGEFQASLLGMFRGVTTLIDFVVNNPRRPEYAQEFAEILANGGGHLYEPKKNPLISRVSRSKEEQELRKRRRELATRKRRLADYRIDGPSERIVNRMVALSEKKDVRLIFVDLPVTQEFRGFFSDGEYEIFLEYVEDLQVRPTVEFHNLSRERLMLTERDFADLDHLNKRGARILSRHLAEILSQYFPPEGSQNLATSADAGSEDIAF